MVEFCLALFFAVGLGVRCRRRIRGADPRQSRMHPAQRERERRTGRLPASGVPLHPAVAKEEGGAGDPFLPWAER